MEVCKNCNYELKAGEKKDVFCPNCKKALFVVNKAYSLSQQEQEKVRYSPEVVELVRQNIDFYSYPEIVKMIKEKFFCDMKIEHLSYLVRINKIEKAKAKPAEETTILEQVKPIGKPQVKLKKKVVEVLKKDIPDIKRNTKYSSEIVEFIRDNVNKSNNKELIKLVNKKFGCEMDRPALVSLMIYRKIKRNNEKLNDFRKYNSEIIDFIKSIRNDFSNEEIAQKILEKFNIKTNAKKVELVICRHGLQRDKTLNKTKEKGTEIINIIKNFKKELGLSNKDVYDIINNLHEIKKEEIYLKIYSKIFS